MKSHLIMVATLIIVSAVAFAGCVEINIFEPTPSSTPVVNPTVTPAVTPTATPTPTVTPTPTAWSCFVSASASQNTRGDITVIFHGGPTTAHVTALDVTVISPNSIIYCESDAILSVAPAPAWNKGEVGATATFRKNFCNDLSPAPNDDVVCVVATFRDGTECLILDTHV